MMQSLIGQTIYEYSRLQGQMPPNDINFCGLVSDMSMPTNIEDLYVGNKIMTPIIPLACMDDPVKCSQLAK